ncbi:MAG: hypothetical protein SPI52_06485 [Bacilli bacterium]|nr:hypothetical protein [Bacilli bacterium]
MINKKLSPLLLEMEELVNKQDEEEFLFFINNYQEELLKEDPVSFISFHVDFYALKDDINKTLEVVNYYKNAPYISMEVEDMLNELKNKLEHYRDSQNKGQKSKSNDELEKELFSNNENAIASALTYLSKQNIRMYIPLLKKFLISSDVVYKYKTLVLFMLVEQKIDEEIDVYKDGLIYTITPSLLELPFDTYEYQLCKEEIEKTSFDNSIKNIAVELLNTAQIKEYPSSFVDMDNIQLMKDIFIQMAISYLDPTKKDIDEKVIRSISTKHAITSESVRETIQELNEAIIK